MAAIPVSVRTFLFQASPNDIVAIHAAIKNPAFGP